jgi:hypothetical protein
MHDLTELTDLFKLTAAADITDEAKNSARWCLDQMPKLYRDFRSTNESRYFESINNLARAMLKRLGEAGAGDDAGKVCEAVVRRLGEMHRRLGIAPLALPTTAAPRGGRKRKVG